MPTYSLMYQNTSTVELNPCLHHDMGNMHSEFSLRCQEHRSSNPAEGTDSEWPLLGVMTLAAPICTYML